MSYNQILLISLHKLGDNLQAAAALPILDSIYPCAKITVLTEKGFEFPFLMNRFVDEIVLYQRKNAYVSEQLKELRERKFDLIINRQSSSEGASIAGYIGAGEIRGYFLREDGSGWVLDPWSRLLFSACRNRSVNPFNFVDYSINIAGESSIKRGLCLEVETGASDSVVRRIDGGNGRIIAVQVGVNAERRQWGAERFGQAVNMILNKEKDISFAFIGTEMEAPLIDKAISTISTTNRVRAYNLSGALPLALLPDFLQRCSLLLTNDTGPMHFAAAVGCPIIAVYAGESFLAETGPYSPNNWVISANIDCLPCLTSSQCLRNSECKERVRPDFVAQLVIDKIKSISPDPSFYSGVKIYHSGPFILRDAIRYTPMFPAELNLDDFMRYVYYASFKKFIYSSEVDMDKLAFEMAIHNWSSVVREFQFEGSPFVDQFALGVDEKEAVISVVKSTMSELRKLLF